MKVGVLTIGQSPRPDLVGPIQQLLPHCDVVEAGALDLQARERLPDPRCAAYPLITRLRDGTQVVVDEGFLRPLLQQAAARLERAGVGICLLACAGPFSALQSAVPLIRPFGLAAAVLHQLGLRRIGVLCPAESQRQASLDKWTGAGFEADAWCPASGDCPHPPVEWVAARVGARPALGCLVLDYFGHPAEYAESLRESVRLPILDLGALATAALAHEARGAKVGPSPCR